MNENYLAVAFRKTIEQRFAAQTDALKAAYLESQILPGIAVYSVMPKEGAL